MINASAAPVRLEISDTALEPGTNPGEFVVRYVEDGNTTYYRVRLSLHGEHLPFVESVTYHLHHTFPNPERRVQRSFANQNCELAIWTWGLFEVHAVVTDKKGGTLRLSRELSYDRDFERKGVRFVQQARAD